MAHVAVPGPEEGGDILRANIGTIAASQIIVWGLSAIFRVHLGDGVTRVKVGERLEHTDMDSTRNYLYCDLMGSRRSRNDDDDPRHPPNLAPGKMWCLVRPAESEFGVVETRKIHPLDSGNNREPSTYVFVLEEGMALPTRELLRVVNTAHAVLVLRGTEEYFYLNDDFVLSADEERRLMEWGVGRPLLANSLLAVGGTLLVAFVEKVWEPAVVGTLLVAAAGYRVQGALTNVLRITSPGWKSDHQLVPGGIHGTERLVQGVLVTLVALADLMDNRWLLLAALTLASAQVVLLECIGQARLTWGYAKYKISLFKQLYGLFFNCFGFALYTWVFYVFAGSVGCFLLFCPLYFGPLAVVEDFIPRHVRSTEGYETFSIVTTIIFGLGTAGVALWAAVLGWGDADLKFTWQSLQPWAWPLLRTPDSFSTVVRIVGLWIGALMSFYFAGVGAAWMFSMKIGSDAKYVVGLGERTRARTGGDSPGFRHYDESTIPSRHLLVPDAAKRTRDVGQQAQPAPVASVV